MPVANGTNLVKVDGGLLSVALSLIQVFAFGEGVFGPMGFVEWGGGFRLDQGFVLVPLSQAKTYGTRLMPGSSS